MADDPDRRKFLRCDLRARRGSRLVIAVPAARLVLGPTRQQTVTTPTEPIDVGAPRACRSAPDWRKVDVVAPVVKDAWTSARDVVLGAAWVRRTARTSSRRCPRCVRTSAARSAGTARSFLCPCHDSGSPPTATRSPTAGPPSAVSIRCRSRSRTAGCALTWVATSSTPRRGAGMKLAPRAPRHGERALDVPPVVRLRVRLGRS